MIQFILGLIFILLLFTVRFAEWYERVPIMGSYQNFYHDFFITDFAGTAVIAAVGIVVMYLLFIASCLFRISPNIFGKLNANEILIKITHFTPLLGLGIIGFNILALGTYYSRLTNIEHVWYAWTSEGFILIFIGGIIVIITGLVANRLSRSESPIGYGGYVEPQPGPSYQQPQVPAQPGYSCPSCGGPLTFVTEYNRWYCYNCKKYL